MEQKLFDSERKVLEILWSEGDTPAKQLADILKEKTNWSKTTTYTVIKKCINKGILERIEPNFVCHAAITRQQAQQHETQEIIEKLYDGHADQLIASILGSGKLTRSEIQRLKQMVDDLE